MPVISASAARSRVARRGAVAVIGLCVVAAVSVATLSNPRLTGAVTDGLNQGIHGVQTVAAMLAERSPGDRPEGALANLKPKREAALHARALPKVRGPGPAAYEALVSAPPIPPVAPPPEAPLYGMVAGGPLVALSPTAAAAPPATPATPGGPPILSNIPSPGGGGGGGGGGGVFSPPIVGATPETPPISLTPASPVPEPASWALMLIGFASMGWTLRRNGRAAREPARG